VRRARRSARGLFLPACAGCTRRSSPQPICGPWRSS
jgi:hypothetical protein